MGNVILQQPEPAHSEVCTRQRTQNNGFWKSRVWESTSARATDFGPGTVLTWRSKVWAATRRVYSRSPESGGLESGGPQGSGHRFRTWNRTYLEVWSLGVWSLEGPESGGPHSSGHQFRIWNRTYLEVWSLGVQSLGVNSGGPESGGPQDSGLKNKSEFETDFP